MMGLAGGGPAPAAAAGAAAADGTAACGRTTDARTAARSGRGRAASGTAGSSGVGGKVAESWPSPRAPRLLAMLQREASFSSWIGDSGINDIEAAVKLRLGLLPPPAALLAASLVAAGMAALLVLLLLPPPPPLLLLDWVAPPAALAFLGSGSSSESSSSSSSSVLRLGLPSPSCRRFWYRGLALAGGAARDAPEVGAGRCSSPESSMPLGAALDAAAGCSPVIAEHENKDGRASAACTGSLGGGFSGRFLANSCSLSSDLFSTEGGVAPTRMPSSSSLIARAVSPSRSSIAALTS
mmetsp:Transcript_1785/g.6336  ORF Transcript_1785/g.6336 Transcript_1785/m.6336 type:complete len:296 (-) Transcript_1785:386-1273(-)